MDYVQVPVERPEAIEEVKIEVVESKEVIKEKKKAELVKQMSLSTDGGGKVEKVCSAFSKFTNSIFHAALAKSGSESSISEACDSVKESKKQFEDEKEECSDKEEQTQSKTQLTIDNKISMSSAKSMTQLKDAGDGVVRRTADGRRRDSKLRSVSHIEQTVDDSDDFEDVAGAVEKGIRPSKSDTSLTESFVMIDNDGGGRRLSNKQNVLRDGEWALFVAIFPAISDRLRFLRFQMATAACVPVKAHHAHSLR